MAAHLGVTITSHRRRDVGGCRPSMCRPYLVLGAERGTAVDEHPNVDADDDGYAPHIQVHDEYPLGSDGACYSRIHSKASAK
jgi:hypothetical protein